VEVVRERDVDGVDVVGRKELFICAVGIPNSVAAAAARVSSRDEMATTSQFSAAWMAGVTFFMPMSAVLSMPHRTVAMLPSSA
jgi:hypothetical protein